MHESVLGMDASDWPLGQLERREIPEMQLTSTRRATPVSGYDCTCSRWVLAQVPTMRKTRRTGIVEWEAQGEDDGFLCFSAKKSYGLWVGTRVYQSPGPISATHFR